MNLSTRNTNYNTTGTGNTLSKFGTLALAIAVALALPATVFAKEFRSADVHPEDYPTVMAVKFMSDIIKKKTDGKHSIKVFTGNALGGEKTPSNRQKLAHSTLSASTSRR